MFVDIPLHYIVVAFVVVNLTFASNSLEIIVLRYKALSYSEVGQNPNGLYEFRFCYCPSDASNERPDTDRSCTCSPRLGGKTTIHSPAIFASSCLHSGAAADMSVGKCLATKLTSNNLNPNGAIYVEIVLDNKPVTYPSWQSLPLSKSKHSMQLRCAKSSQTCADCQLCRSGTIDFTYIVLGEFDSQNNQKPATIKNPIQSVPKTTQDRSRTPTNTRGLDWNLLNAIKRRLEEEHKHGDHAISEVKFDVEEFKRQLTGLQNAYRRIHDAGDLLVDPAAEKAAQRYADHLANTQSCLKHEGDGKYGESLYYYATNVMPNSQELAKSVVDSFYVEGRGYNYRRFKPLDYFKTGHFTQMIWKSTQRLGIGVARVPFDGRKRLECHPTFVGTLIYVVIKYDPPGNVQSQQHYFDNVLQPNDSV